jgi:hypothetical protein
MMGANGINRPVRTHRAVAGDRQDKASSPSTVPGYVDPTVIPPKLLIATTRAVAAGAHDDEVDPDLLNLGVHAAAAVAACSKAAEMGPRRTLVGDDSWVRPGVEDAPFLR